VSDAVDSAGRVVDELVREPGECTSNGQLAGNGRVELAGVRPSVRFVLDLADEQIGCGDGLVVVVLEPHLDAPHLAVVRFVIARFVIAMVSVRHDAFSFSKLTVAPTLPVTGESTVTEWQDLGHSHRGAVWCQPVEGRDARPVAVAGAGRRGHDDYSSTRLVISTSGSNPTWALNDGRDRLVRDLSLYEGERISAIVCRCGPLQEVVAMATDGMGGMILLDVTSGGGEFDRDILERIGHPVKVCHGPDHGSVCPLLSGADCEKFSAAHGVVFELDLDREQHRAIVRRYRELARPEIPIRVVVDVDQARRYAEDLVGVEILTHEPTVADLDGFAAEVEAADR
jgi:hypothetical protein